MERRALTLGGLALMHGANHALTVVLFLAPFFPEMYQQLKATPAQIQALATINLLCYAMANIPMGWLGDRMNKVHLLSMAMILNGLIIIGFGLSQNYNVLIFLAALGGIMGAAYHPVGQALTTQLYPEGKGRALGILGMGASLGYIITPIFVDTMSSYLAIIPSLENVFTWQRGAIAVGGVGVFTGILFLFFADIKGQLSDAPEKQTNSLEIFPWVFIILIIAAFGFRDMISFGIYPLTSGFYQEILALSRRNVAWLLSLYYLPGLIIQPVIGALSDGLDRQRVVIPALLSLGFAMFAAPFLVSIHPALPILLIGGCLSATVPTIDAMVADGVPVAYRSRAYGLLFTFGIGFGSLGPLIFGLVSFNVNYPAAYTLAGIFMCISAFLVTRAHRYAYTQRSYPQRQEY